MDPHDFIAFSGKLAAMPSYGQAGARTATSRAYYGAFHLAVSVLEGVGCLRPGSKPNHVLVPRFLGASSSEDAAMASRLLDSLYEDRRRADYDLGDAVAETQRFAQLNVEMARKIEASLQALKGACSDPTIRQELQHGVARISEAHAIPETGS